MPTKEAIANVMRAAIASGDMKGALEKHGEHIDATQKAALAKITGNELAAIKSLASKGIPLPGDKLA
jgi:hypothetical protein